jgi:glycerophosphoryl diester phosphodiesterase
MPMTPYGNVTGISCHNCYRHESDPSTSLYNTLLKIHAAQEKNADLIELDIVEQGGSIRVDHDDDGDANGALLNQVLSDNALQSGDEILFIEIKETTIDESFVSGVLDMLLAYGYGSNRDRPVVIRAFHNIRGHLLNVKSLLEGSYNVMADSVRLSELFNKNEVSSISTFQDMVLDAKDDGLDMVEFHYQNNNLYSLVSLAHSMGMGVNLWTIPATFGEVYIAALRDEVDVLTVEYDIAKARQIVKDDNGLVYMNSSAQTGAGNFVRYHRADNRSFLFDINQIGTPEYEILGFDEDRFGSSLVFNAADQQYVPFYDGDNSSGNGYLVAVIVNFDDLSLAEGEKRSIIAKSDSGGFCLEQYNPTIGEEIIRFGVRVGSSYRFATYPAANLDGTNSFLIVGAYDGNGGVYIWINNSNSGATNSSGVGEVVRNNSPILLGADPQGASSQRYFFSGKIQIALVQDWGNH